LEFIINKDERPNKLFNDKDYSSFRQYIAYTLDNINEIEKLEQLPASILKEMEIVAHVLPFKTNNYVINNLINWDSAPNDPIFKLNFPQKEMLIPRHYKLMKDALEQGSNEIIKNTAQAIRLELNPNPAGQKKYNVPTIGHQRLPGTQHKYRETALLFPKSGQTCHAFCTFCFRWSQFAKIKGEYKFGALNIENFIEYLQESPTVTDVLVTGGDPMVMRASVLERYLRPIIEADIPHLQSIRIGSKSLSYWPYRYLSDRDSEDILALFTDIVDSGLHLAFMAHFNHYQELQSYQLEQAVQNILDTGAIIRTQSPILRPINASTDIWIKMLNYQVELGMIPYYMFIARDTGAQRYFAVPLVEAWKIFRKVYSHISGLGRTIRGPTMSCTPGKINILGPQKIIEQKVLALSFIQGRNPQWVNKPFYAKYDPKALWITDLEPAFGEEFFYEEELDKFLGPYNQIEKAIPEETE
jgi:L-lysine 2,3-aminomutase